MPLLNRRHLMQSLGAASVALATPVANAGSSWRKPAFENLSKIAEDRVIDDQAVGICIGVSAPGFRKMAYYGVEDTRTGTPISATTKFRIASVTKPITATCVLDLCERGQLSLDHTLEPYFSDFPAAADITIHDLLSHTSGLANWWGRLPTGAPEDFMDRPDPHKVLAKMRQPFLFTPGTMRSYSNSGYLLLGEIIEKITASPFDDWLRTALLSRCGASGMELERTGMTAPDWATGYFPGSSRDRVVGTPMPFAAGGLRSNLHDVLAFSDALFHGKLLSGPSFQKMVAHARVRDGRLVQDAMYDSPQAPAEPWPSEVTEFGYGLGINTWIQSGERFYSHAGLIDGFSAYLIHAPRTQTTVAVLSNAQDGTLSMRQTIRDTLIAA